MNGPASAATNEKCPVSRFLWHRDSPSRSSVWRRLRSYQLCRILKAQEGSMHETHAHGLQYLNDMQWRVVGHMPLLVWIGSHRARNGGAVEVEAANDPCDCACCCELTPRRILLQLLNSTSLLPRYKRTNHLNALNDAPIVQPKRFSSFITYLTSKIQYCSDSVLDH